MKKLAHKTKHIRGCSIFGNNPTNTIILYSDNCSSHCNELQINRLKRRDKIHCRPLIPNCTHVQQPVDQNVGFWMQCKMQKYLQRK